MSTHAKRQDIQGLRALAVIGVLFFHLDGLLPGGFVGVDVFFVISGFVIWTILTKEVAVTQSIDISRFLAARFFRLMPAMGVVVTFTVLISSLVFTSRSLHETAALTAISALAANSNLVIAYISGGYFGQAAEANPLLHTWSLSVEWQFYLLVPLLVFLWRSGGKKRGVSRFTLSAGLLLLGMSSFLFNFADIPDLANRVDINGFYSPIGRFWEFAAGALASQLVKKFALPHRLAELTATIGFSGIVGSFFFFHEEMQTPGRSTLLPVVATVLMIWAGGQSKSFVTKAMSFRPLTVIGDLSYSIYLWHWPIFFFSRQLNISESIGSATVQILITIGLSWWTFKYVENPLRLTRAKSSVQKSAWSQKPKLYPALSLILVPLVTIGLLNSSAVGYRNFLVNNGVVESIAGDIGHDEFHRTVAEHFEECADPGIRSRALSWEGFLRCQQSTSTRGLEVAIVGDSHAEHLFYGVAQAIPERAVGYYIQNALPTLTGSESMSRILHHVAETKSIETVIISAYWVRRGVPSEDLRETVAYLRESGKRVIITNDIPTADGITADGCKTSLYLFGPRVCDWKDSNQDLQSEISESLQRIADETSAHLVDTYSLFCNGPTCGLVAQEGGSDVILYRDLNHLNLPGSAFVAAELVPWIR